MTETNSLPIDQKPLRNPRRWFRFSLRTLLIFVTAIALLLGLWIVPSERQRRFCRSLSELGHSSQFEGEDPEARRHNSWYEHYYRNIASVDHLAYSSERLDQRFAELDWRAVPKLKEIDFGFLCTNEANKIIKNLPTSLQKLRARESLNDESMLLISRFPELQTIEILSEEVTPSGLDHLVRLKKLRSLSFDSFYSISRAEPNLIPLRPLIRDRNKHGEFLCDLSMLNDLQNLEKLSLESVTLSEVAIENICKLKNLKELNLDSSRFNRSAISKFSQLSNLKDLAFSGKYFVDGIESRDLLNLKELTNLEILEIDASLWEKQIVEELERALPKLQVKVYPGR